MNHQEHIIIKNRSHIAGLSSDVFPMAKTKRDSCDSCASQRTCHAASLMRELTAHQQQLTFHLHKIRKGKGIFFAGDKLEALYVVKSGLFKSYSNSEAGDEQIMAFHMSGQVIGADGIAHGRHRLSAKALENSTICTIDHQQLDALNNQFVQKWLMEQIDIELLRERHLLAITRKKYNSEARIALFLLELAEQYKSRGYSDREFKLIMPQRDIANYLDMVLETVSRVLTRLQEASVITINRPYITISNIDKLRATTEELCSLAA